MGGITLYIQFVTVGGHDFSPVLPASVLKKRHSLVSTAPFRRVLISGYLMCVNVTATSVMRLPPFIITALLLLHVALAQAQVAPVSIAEPVSVTEPFAEPVSADEPVAEPVAVSEPIAIAEPGFDPIAEPVAEPASIEPIAEPIAGPVGFDPIAEPVSEPAAEPASVEPDAEPVVEPVAEPVDEPIDAEPVGEPVAEPAGEPIAAEPVAEPIDAEPIGEPVADEPVAEPIAFAPSNSPVVDSFPERSLPYLAATLTITGSNWGTAVTQVSVNGQIFPAGAFNQPSATELTIPTSTIRSWIAPDNETLVHVLVYVTVDGVAESATADLGAIRPAPFFTTPRRHWATDALVEVYLELTYLNYYSLVSINVNANPCINMTTMPYTNETAIILCHLSAKIAEAGDYPLSLTIEELNYEFSSPNGISFAVPLNPSIKGPFPSTFIASTETGTQFVLAPRVGVWSQDVSLSLVPYLSNNYTGEFAVSAFGSFEFNDPQSPLITIVGAITWSHFAPNSFFYAAINSGGSLSEYIKVGYLVAGPPKVDTIVGRMIPLDLRCAEFPIFSRNMYYNYERTYFTLTFSDRSQRKCIPYDDYWCKTDLPTTDLPSGDVHVTGFVTNDISNSSFSLLVGTIITPFIARVRADAKSPILTQNYEAIASGLAEKYQVAPSDFRVEPEAVQKDKRSQSYVFVVVTATVDSWDATRSNPGQFSDRIVEATRDACPQVESLSITMEYPSLPPQQPVIEAPFAESTPPQTSTTPPNAEGAQAPTEGGGVSPGVVAVIVIAVIVAIGAGIVVGCLVYKRKQRTKRLEGLSDKQPLLSDQYNKY
jgi:hypothetical protein